MLFLPMVTLSDASSDAPSAPRGIVGPPTIVEKPAMTVAGVVFDPEREGWDCVPSAFYVLCLLMPGLAAASRGGALYGVIHGSGQGAERRPSGYLAGVEVEDGAALPQGCRALRMRAQRYAVFTVHGNLGDIAGAYAHINERWLGSHGYVADETADTMPVEAYGPAFRPHRDSQFEIWIPVTPSAAPHGG
ncbi:MAG TPA: GyrI-like domain-containing protein [Chthonomonadales bacterium]|nr:GyrI-like domain-containing protein [Chthonomonadales bacterium]